MSAENPNTCGRRGILSTEEQAAFKEDAQAMGDTALARKYGLSDRTATNWRIRLVGARTKEKSPGVQSKGSAIPEAPKDSVGSSDQDTREACRPEEKAS